MSNSKYFYDTKTLSYKPVVYRRRDKIGRGLLWILSSVAAGLLIYLGASQYVLSPKEKALLDENQNLRLQFDILNKKIDEAIVVLEDIEQRDKDVYRVILEADTFPKGRNGSFLGDANKYKKLEGENFSDLVIETSKKIDTLKQKMLIQTYSLDEIAELALNKDALLRAIPAIQPVANKDLKRMASGYGMRYHPILKYRKMHYGMDFTANTGTKIMATGDGVVKKVKTVAGGYGKHVIIDHGFGYETYYAHMSKFNVKRGQKVKRGEIIGYVGNTGRSTGPHCHYEVHKNGIRVNPVNFYHQDLTAEEYEIMLKKANEDTQSFD